MIRLVQFIGIEDRLVPLSSEYCGFNGSQCLWQAIKNECITFLYNELGEHNYYGITLAVISLHRLTLGSQLGEFTPAVA